MFKRDLGVDVEVWMFVDPFIYFEYGSSSRAELD